MIIADSGFWLALGDKRDKHHQRANLFAKTCKERLITTHAVMTKVCHLLLKRQGVEAQLQFMEMYRLGAFDVFEIQEIHKDRLVTLMRQYRVNPVDERGFYSVAACFGSQVIRDLVAAIAGRQSAAVSA